MFRITIFCAFWMLATGLAAQQNNNWYFGHSAGVNFTGGVATATSGPLDALEGTACISDAIGNVMFYTEGSTVWDRNNNIMPNGNGLGGGASSTQAALIVPKPGACGIYYIFTTEDHFGNGDFRYSVVDMCLNNGYGDVIQGEKNILIDTPCAEKLTAVPNTNGTDYWIIVHRLGGDDFLAFSLTPGGLNFVPVMSAVGSNHPSNCLIGPMKASPNGQKLVCENTFCSLVEMFDFDATTGVVSNAVDLVAQYNLPNGFYGVEFSPDGNLLYLATTFAANLLYQIDLVNSQSLLVYDPGLSGYNYGALQLAPDGQIYLARKDEAFLDVITAPNVVGLGCGFTPGGFPLAAATTSDVGMPCMIPSTILNAPVEELDFSLGADTSFCNAAPFDLLPPTPCNANYLWQDGSTAPTFTVTEPGVYWVEVSNACAIGSDTIEVFGNGGLGFDLGPDTTVCTGSPLVLNTPASADSVLWQDGSTLTSYTVSNAGTYSVTVFSGGCFGTDSLQVIMEQPVIADFTYTIDPCALSATFTDMSVNNASQAWTFGDGNNGSGSPVTHTYGGPGSYDVVITASNSCGPASAMQTIDLPAAGTITVNGPDTLCASSPADFTAVAAGFNIVDITWSNGITDQNPINYGPANSVDLTATVIGDNGCEYTDVHHIEVLPLPVADFTYTPIDCGNSVLFDEDCLYTTAWWWDLGNGTTSSTASPSASYNAPGTFNVMLVATNACGVDTVQAVLELGPSATLALIGPNALCEGDTATYTAVLGGGSIVTVEWNIGNSSSAVTELSFESDATVTVNVLADDGCTYSVSLDVSVAPGPVAAFSSTSLACDSAVQFQNLSTAMNSWLWYLGNGTTSNAMAPLAEYPGSGSYDVSLVVYGDCGTDSIMQPVIVGGIGSLELSGPSVQCDGTPVALNLSLQGTEIASILWSTGDTATSILVDATTDPIVSAMAIGIDGCTYTAGHVIQIVGVDGEGTLYMPNVFTPNGDGINEHFGPVMVDPSGLDEMIIFNRWGEEIYHTNSAYAPWDGSYGGALVPDGTYVVLVKWFDQCRGENADHIGHVTVVR